MHGVEEHPVWESVPDGWRPDDRRNVHLHSGELLELPALQRLRFDVIVSIDKLFLLEPTKLMCTLYWFWDHLKPGGRCLIATPTFAHPDGADLGDRAPRFSHLLFSGRDIADFLERTSRASPRYVNPSCAATYLVQFARAGFVIESADRVSADVDEDFIAEHHAKLSWLDPVELRTSGLRVTLRRPLVPVLSVVDGDAARG